MSDSSIVFSATGAIQTYVVPYTGCYVIEASGAQGGDSAGGGGRGARVKGTFYLGAGDILQIVVGQRGEPGSTPHQPAGGGGGGTFIWRGLRASPLPEEPLLAAGGGGGGDGGDGLVSHEGGEGAAPGGRHGYGGDADPGNFRYSGGGGTGWRGIGSIGSAPTMCGGGLQWRGGKGANYCLNLGGSGGYGGGGGGAFIGRGSGGGGGYSGGGGGTQAGPHAGGGGSFNAGAFPVNTPGIQAGNGHVTILAVPAPMILGSLDPFPSQRSNSEVGAAHGAGLEGRGYF